MDWITFINLLRQFNNHRGVVDKEHVKKAAGEGENIKNILLKIKRKMWQNR
jgi:hypothetical protein